MPGAAAAPMLTVRFATREVLHGSVLGLALLVPARAARGSGGMGSGGRRSSISSSGVGGSRVGGSGGGSGWLSSRPSGVPDGCAAVLLLSSGAAAVVHASLPLSGVRVVYADLEEEVAAAGGAGGGAGGEGGGAPLHVPW
eukprot:362599-Chlamydomonas_euryale.AAC.1